MMDSDVGTVFWQIVQPSTWPNAPSWMSFSTMTDLEACPRRWALSAAQYSAAWGTHGYPRAPQLAALEGTVVHLSLQMLTGALARNGSPSLTNEIAVETLKELGGFSAVIRTGLDKALKAYESNPRAVPVLEGLHRRLLAHIPKLRSRIQRFLARLDPEVSAISYSCSEVRSDNEARQPLLPGSYAEVDLRSSLLGWRGIADLLTLSNDRCEIRDFKTGKPKKEHELQLRIYALLWAMDRDLNPTQRLADKLIISYENADTEVPAPTESELKNLENELRARTEQVLNYLQVNPPEARPNLENCTYCSVRHICDEYWRWYTRKTPTQSSTGRRFGDVQISITGRHGPRSWDGIVEYGPNMQIGAPVLLRTAIDLVPFYPGQRGRLLNVHIVSPEEAPEGEPKPDPCVVVSVGASSEVFLLSH